MYLANPATAEIWEDTDEVRSHLISLGYDLANYRQCATEDEAIAVIRQADALDRLDAANRAYRQSAR